MKKVVFPLWSSSGRDFHIVMPVVYYLEKIKNYDVHVISIWDWYIVDKLKPDLIIFSNIEGGNTNLKFAKYLKSKGYPVVSLTSEGNYLEESLEEFFWGVNQDKVLYEDIKYLWSQRCLNMILKKYPQLDNKLKVSGGIGFDRYKIYPFISKVEFLNKYNKSHYKKVIGYACWGFDGILTDDQFNLIDDNSLKTKIGVYKYSFGQSDYNEYVELKSDLIKLLYGVITDNKDTLFILKLHPGTYRDDLTEIAGLDLENVLILKSEEEIADIINACDIWMAFDSTTTLEAWLLNKPTINILLPPKRIQVQNLILRGTVVAPDNASLQNYIDEYYISKMIGDFESKRTDRDFVIKQIIQNDDGMNHARLGEDISDMLEHAQPLQIMRDNTLIMLKLYSIHLLKKLSKHLKKIGPFDTLNFVKHQVLEEDIAAFKRDYYPYLDAFHVVK